MAQFKESESEAIHADSSALSFKSAALNTPVFIPLAHIIIRCIIHTRLKARDSPPLADTHARSRCTVWLALLLVFGMMSEDPDAIGPS